MTTSEAECMWCRAAVASHGSVCPECLDARVRQINRAIKVHTPAAGLFGGGCLMADELVELVRPLVADRRSVMARMDPVRRRYWGVVNDLIPLPHGLIREPGESAVLPASRSSPA